MKQYKILPIRLTVKNTEKKLNELSKEGWEMLCSLNIGSWIILFKEIN